MKFMNRLVSVGVLSLLCISGAQAATVWSGSTKITHLYPASDRLIFMTSYSHTVSTCNGGKRFSLNASASDYKTQAAVLMAAFYSGRNINMAFSDTQTPACDAKINRFTVSG